MAWKVKLFETERGKYPVEEFIKEQDPPTIAKIAHEINLLEKYGPFLGMPHSKKIASDLYELRARGMTEVRIVYTFHKGTIVLLHAFKKEQQKISPRELKVARNRRTLLDKT